MREIISMQVGGCGNAMGDGFWKLISTEHGVDYKTGAFNGTNPLQLERINVFFNATASKCFYARTLCIDTESSTINNLRAHSSLYRPGNMIAGTESAGNNFARAYHTNGAAILEETLNANRREAENTDALQGFQIFHSIGGGTGSGLTALIMGKLVEEYPDNLISNYVSIPAPSVSQSIVEPYNALLSIPSLINQSHLTFCLDNEALFNICRHQLQIANSSYEHVNHIVALTISGLTTCLRFPGQLNAGLRKIFVNMVPFPRLHFLVTGFAPLLTCKQTHFSQGTVGEIVQQLFSAKSLLCAIDLKNGKLLTAAGIFRGRMSTREVDQLMENLRNKHSDYFVSWIPNNIKTAICDIPPPGMKMSATFLGNTTAISEMLQRVLDLSTVMLRRKAHLHWYTGEGMEEQEFIEAQQELKTLIEDYVDSGEMVASTETAKPCPHCGV